MFWERAEPEGECLVWRGNRNHDGYGRIGWNHEVLYTHRLSWELTFGAIPDGRCVLHHCDNPPCIRPEHLFLGTKADNAFDMIAKGRNRPHGKVPRQRLIA